MRKSDKKKNLQKVNLLAEQRYLQSKGIISEMFSGPEIDIDGITTSLVKTTLQGGDDSTVYMRAKDSLVDSNDQVKGEFYNMLANKFQWSDLPNLAQQYRSIAKQYTLGLDEMDLQEMDYERVIDDKDLDFLNKPEFSGWEPERVGDSEFKIKNKKYPYFEFVVTLTSGKNAAEYPWDVQGNHIGGKNYSPHGHKGFYNVWGAHTKHLEGSLRHILNWPAYQEKFK